MKITQIRPRTLSAVAGIAIGVAMMFSFVSVQPTVAGDYCPDTFNGSGPCTGGYCFTPIAGAKTCKYHQAGCSGPCQSSGGGGGGGGDLPEDPPQN